MTVMFIEGIRKKEWLYDLCRCGEIKQNKSRSCSHCIKKNKTGLVKTISLKEEQYKKHLEKKRNGI